MRDRQKGGKRPERVSGGGILTIALFQESICIMCRGRMRIVRREFISRWSELVIKQCIKCGRKFSYIFDNS